MGSLALTIWSFHKVEPLAATLLLPYLGVAIFAAFLTSTLINMNPQVRSQLCTDIHNTLFDHHPCCCSVAILLTALYIPAASAQVSCT